MHKYFKLKQIFPVFLSFLIPGIHLAADPSLIVSDDFNTQQLNVKTWSFTNPVNDSSFSMNGKELIIRVPGKLNHELWVNEKTSPRLMQTAQNTSFEIEAKFSSQFSAQFQMQGVLIEQDSQNFLRLEFLASYSKNNPALVVPYIFIASFRNNQPWVRLYKEIGPLDAYYLRVNRNFTTEANDSWSIYYSGDGMSWQLAAAFNNYLHVTQVGFYAGNAQPQGKPLTDTPAFECSVDYFFNNKLRIEPEDGYPDIKAVKIESSGSGTVHIIPETKPFYRVGEQLVLEARAAPLWEFKRWEGDVTGTESFFTFGITVNLKIKAIFEPAETNNPNLEIKSDDFSQPVLNAQLWEFIDPLNDAGYALNGKQLQIYVSDRYEHESWNTGNNAPRIMQTVSNMDFQIEVKFESALNTEYQMQGIIVEQDTANYLRIEFYASTKGTHLFVAYCSNGRFVWPPVYNGLINKSDVYYLMLNRRQNQWTISYANEAFKWIKACEFTYSINVSAVGVHAGNAGGQTTGLIPAFTCLVDYFFNSASPVIPEDGDDGGGAGTQPYIVSDNFESQTLRTDIWNFINPYHDAVLHAVPGAFTLEIPGKQSHPVGSFYLDRPWELILDLKFEDQPALSIKDSSLYNQQVVTNRVPYSFPLGVSGQAFQFDGYQDCLILAHNDLLDFTSLTIASWIYLDTYKKEQYIVARKSGNSELLSNFALLIGGHNFRKLEFNLELAGSGNVNKLISNEDMPLNRWIHVAATFDGKKARLIIQGEVVKTDYHFSGSPAYSTSPVYLGTNALASDKYFKGKVDEFTLFNIALSKEELAGLAQNRKPWHSPQLYLAPRLNQAIPDESFEFEIKFDSLPLKQYQMHGISLENDSQHYLDFIIYSDGQNIKLFINGSKNGFIETKYHQTIEGNTPHYLKIKRNKSLNEWQVSYALNRQQWQLLARFNYALVTNFLNITGGNYGLGSSAYPYTVLVDYIFNPDPAASGNTIFPPDPFPDRHAVKIRKYGHGNIVISPVSANGEYALNTVLQLTAVPVQGHEFVSWSGSVAGAASQTSLLVTGDQILTAVFKETPAAVDIDIWYGEHQYFGQAGLSQKWLNVLGNIIQADNLERLTYTVNNSLTSYAVNVAYSAHSVFNDRLVKKGDFNIELDYAALNTGLNTIRLTAQDVAGKEVSKTVNIYVQHQESPPASFSIDWNNVANLQNIVQIVDGQWEIIPGGLHSMSTGYDRLVAIGDISWHDYEVIVPIIIHQIHPNPASSYGKASLGVLLRWQGHQDGWESNPRTKWYPMGALACYNFNTATDGYYMLWNSSGKWVRTVDHPLKLLYGNSYLLKMRVETVYRTTSSGLITRSLYSYKAWPAGTTEPVEWIIQYEDSATSPQFGSVLIVAHYVDITIGNVTVQPVTSSSAAATMPLMQLQQIPTPTLLPRTAPEATPHPY